MLERSFEKKLAIVNSKAHRSPKNAAGEDPVEGLKCYGHPIDTYKGKGIIAAAMSGAEGASDADLGRSTGEKGVSRDREWARYLGTSQGVYLDLKNNF